MWDEDYSSLAAHGSSIPEGNRLNHFYFYIVVTEKLDVNIKINITPSPNVSILIHLLFLKPLFCNQQWQENKYGINYVSW